MRGLSGTQALALLLVSALAPAAAHAGLRPHGRGHGLSGQHKHKPKVSMMQLLRHASDILLAGRQGPMEGGDPIGPLRKPTVSVKFEKVDSAPGDGDVEYGDDDDDGDDDDETQIQVAGPSTPAPTREPDLYGQIDKELKDYVDAVADAKADWEENLHEQDEVHAELLDIRDDRSFYKMVDKKVQKMVNETQTPLVAAFLGDMRKETRKWAKPEYEDDLELQGRKLKRQEPKLHQAYLKAKAEYDEEFQRRLTQKTGKRAKLAEPRKPKQIANATKLQPKNQTNATAKPSEGAAGPLGMSYPWLLLLILSPAL